MRNKIIFSILVGTLFFSTNLLSQQDTSAIERVYIKIEIKGLACPYCAFGMEKELLKVAGVEHVDIELKKGLAFISTPISQKPLKNDLKKTIEDAGFTAGEIEFKLTPFDRKNNKKEK